MKNGNASLLIFISFGFWISYAFAIAQAPSPTVIGTPTKTKRTVPASALKPGEFDYSMRGSHERQMKEEEMQKKGMKISEWGSVGKIPKLPPPSNFKVVAENGFAYLSWDAVPSKDILFNENGKSVKREMKVAYTVFISEDGKKFRERTATRETKALIDGLTNGKIYYFAVSTVGGNRGEKTLQSVVPMVATPGTIIDWQKLHKH